MEQRPIRVLFVDDEPGIRLTLPAILQMHGLQVTVTASVAEALHAIDEHSFDVLLADLNIGQPGDGFTIVSAMRRTQPNAVTIIITGYPAFETALEAIRNQVDDYIVKPANIDHLIQVIRDRLEHPAPQHHIAPRRASAILRDNSDEIVAQWLMLANADPDLSVLPLSGEQRSDHLPDVLLELVEMLEERPGVISVHALTAAERHGMARHHQGYTVPMLLKEARLLRRCLYQVLQENLLGIDISHLLTDIELVNESLDDQLKTSIEAFLKAEKQQQAA